MSGISLSNSSRKQLRAINIVPDSATKLGGGIDVTELTNLMSISANDNDIGDFIFSEQTNKNLKVVKLNDNKLIGSANKYIPQNAATIALDRNLLTTINSLETYTKLKDFRCSENNIPINLPALNTNIVTFQMNKNNLTGNIHDLSNNAVLEDYQINGNDITGTLPSDVISNNSNLRVFKIGSNANLTGNVPDLSNNKQLTIYEGSFTQVGGPIPSLNFNTKLRALSSSNSGLTGPIPSLNLNTALANFVVDENNLTGSIPSLNNNTALVKFEANNNSLDGWLGTTWPSTLSKQIIKIGNNKLNTGTLDSLLTALDTSGALSGTLEIGGTNSLPTSGNYNPAKVSLQNKDWTVDIAGGVDTSFSTQQGYTSNDEDLQEHPDWEGDASTLKPNQWKMDGANNKITCTSTANNDPRNVRTKNPIKVMVGSKVKLSAEFDFGSGPFAIDSRRTFMLSLVDVNAAGSGNVLEHPNESFLITFRSPFGVGPAARLYRRMGAGVDSVVIGDLDLDEVNDDILRLELVFDIKATAAESTITVSYESLTDATGMTPTNPVVVTTGLLPDLYAGLVNSTNNIKMNIQANEIEDTGVGTLTVYRASAKSIH